MSPVKYELDFYILEDGILHSHRLENFDCYFERSCLISSLLRFSLRARLQQSKNTPSDIGNKLKMST
jgi:hypothetical protein